MIEPFAGSLAVLLLRPDPPKVETVNDLDVFVANFWRATQADPEAVAEYADNPVSESDLHARHRWLVGLDAPSPWTDTPYLHALAGPSEVAAAFEEFRTRMRTDPHYHDAKRAGWWCWGLCAWIGSGWCSTGAEWRQIPAGKQTLTGVHGDGPREGRPQLADAYDIGRGVNASAPESFTLPAKRPAISGGDNHKLGVGVNAWGDNHFANAPALPQRVPRLGARFGNADLPGVLNPGQGQDGTCAARRAWLIDWFSRLRDRLRLVRVCCGDWSRVCSSESTTTRLGTTGVFLDPPYAYRSGRAKNLYAQDSGTVADDVRKWCLDYGANPLMRIVLAGYAGEGHEELEQHGWTVVEWVPGGGYANRSAVNEGKAKERLWCSPHCVREKTLFD